MHFESLANELILHIFRACDSIQDAHALASVNHRLHAVFAGSQKLPILLLVAENQFGPVHDAVQVLTYNSSQPAHLVRNAPVSLALLKQLVHLGSTAQRWTEYYPLKKWKNDYENRRLLTDQERYHVRRAVYRLWLYSKAFHNSRYARTTRNLRQNVLERAELLHNWNSTELAEMEDVREVIRDVVQRSICPSNGTIQTKFRKRFPESDHQLLFNIHLNYPPPPTPFHEHFHSANQPNFANTAFPANMRYKTNAWHEVGSEGWGDDIPHYYVVEDMLKLDPGQILWLKENAPLKGMVESYVKNFGEWFENNGETFGQTVEWVLNGRGEDAAEFRDLIVHRELGVVRE